jgi:hypothetical protein
MMTLVYAPSDKIPAFVELDRQGVNVAPAIAHGAKAIQFCSHEPDNFDTSVSSPLKGSYKASASALAPGFAPK